MSRGYGKICVDLNNIDEALHELEKAKEWVNEQSDKLVSELANDGAQVADTIFQSVPSTEQGSSSLVTVESKYMDSTIKASGEAVVAIEFGAGVLTSPYPVESTDVSIGDGEWSRINKQVYINKGYWFYDGHRMSGLGAYKPMMNAGQTIRRDVSKKAKEVFNQ